MKVSDVGMLNDFLQNIFSTLKYFLATNTLGKNGVAEFGRVLYLPILFQPSLSCKLFLYMEDVYNKWCF